MSHRPPSPGDGIVSGPQGFLEDCRRHPSTAWASITLWAGASRVYSFYLLLTPVSIQGSKDVLCLFFSSFFSMQNCSYRKPQSTWQRGRQCQRPIPRTYQGVARSARQFFSSWAFSQKMFWETGFVQVDRRETPSWSAHIALLDLTHWQIILKRYCWFDLLPILGMPLSLVGSLDCTNK